MHRLLLGGIWWAASIACAQSSIFTDPPEHPAIDYYQNLGKNRITELNRRLREGEVRLLFDQVNGYLPSVLKELGIPVESQMVVFSKTSLQKELIGPRNPRMIFFNDSVAAAWVRGERFLEIATHDPRQGAIFYTLFQQPGEKPQFERDDDCLTCHLANSCFSVAGFLLRSVYPAPDGSPQRTLGFNDTNHRTPLGERWGGWYVTGKTGSLEHLGNRVYPDAAHENVHKAIELPFRLPLDVSPYSDVVALMVFEHQATMMNLLTRYGWQIRVAAHDQRSFDLRDGAREIADYMLFIHEAPIAAKIEGTSGFAQKFTAAGPRDPHGRSLRDLDLEHRLMRYPCSYMIYSDAFDSLPAEGKQAIYGRLREILSGQEKDPAYSVLSAADRRNITEILRATKKDFAP